MLGKKKIFKTIFSRILFINIVLVIIATIIPQAAFINFFMPNYEMELNQQNMILVQQMQKTIDGQILAGIVTLPATYLSDLPINGDLTYPINNNISDDASRIWSVQKRLAEIKVTSGIIDSFDILYLRSNLLFMDNGVQFLNDDSSIKMHDINWVNWIKEMDQNVAWVPNRHLVRYQERDVTSFVSRIPFNASKEDVKAIAVINIDQKMLSAAMMEVGLKPDRVLLIVDRDGNVVARGKNSFEHQNISESKLFQQITEADGGGMLKATLDGRANVVSFSKSNINDWTYISMASIQSFYEKSNGIIAFMVGIGVVILILNLVAVVLMTRKTHEPIQNIFNNIRAMTGRVVADGPNTRAGVPGEGELQARTGASSVSEYNQLSFMVRNIESTIENLNDKLAKNRPLIRYDIISKLLSGEISPVDRSKLYDIRLDKELAVCFVLKISRNSLLSMEDSMLLHYSLADIMEREEGDYSVYILANGSSDMAGIINFTREMELEKIEARLRQKVESLLKTSFCLCMGAIRPIDTDGVKNSFEEAGICADYTFVKPGERLIRFDELKVDSKKETAGFSKLAGAIEDAVKASDKATLRKIIHSVIDEIMTGDYKVEYCKNSLMDIVTLIRLSSRRMGLMPDEIFGGDIREIYRGMEDINEVRHWLDGVIDICMSKLEEKKGNSYDDLIIRIKRHIESSIYGDTSLEGTAEKMNMSAGHLSRIFKDKEDVTFSAYVTGVKLQRGEELLKQGNMTVKEISEKLGYNSVHHFIRIFKDKYGYTPKVYQKAVL